MTVPKTGKVTYKQYECVECGHREGFTTNHYGEIYGSCRACPPWRRPTAVMRCLEPLPEGWGVPEPWKVARIADLA